MSELKQHPLSAAFPAMAEAEFRELVEDIRKHGQRDPILIHEGMVLDGWHRYRACAEIGIKPLQFAFAQGKDPVAFVESVNLHRRHLTASQRAMAIVTLKEWATAGNPNVAAAATLKATNEEMAREAKVSPRLIRDAKAAQKAGLADPVRDGAMTAEEAAKVANGKTEPKQPKTTPKEVAPPPDDFAPSAEEIAEAERALEDELTALRKVVEADDQLAAAMAEIKRLNALNRVLDGRIEGLQNEKNELIRIVKSLRRKLEVAA